MRNMLWGITVGIGVVLFGLSLVPRAADASAREYFKCKLVEGATAGDVTKLATDFMVLARKEGLSDYSLELLWPLFGSDISPGTFHWAGLAPNAERIGAGMDFWENSAANANIRKRFEALATCASSSIHRVTVIK